MNNSHQTKLLIMDIVFALPAEQWQVRLIPDSLHDDLPIISPVYSTGQLIGAVGFLRYKNRNGYHAYARPMTNRHVLIDDLDQDALDQLERDQLGRAVAVQTSKGNYQAWITVSEDEISSQIATKTARLLAERYHGDSGSADYCHLGRLPGFTNRKEIHWTETGYPFTKFNRPVKLGAALGGAQLLTDAERLPGSRSRPLHSSTHGACAPTTSSRGIDPSRSTMTAEQANQFYKSELLYQAERNGWDMPIQEGLRSHADFEVVRGLRIKYGMDPDDLAALLLLTSEKAGERSGISGLDYVLRTVAAT